MTSNADIPVICRILGHSMPREWVQSSWGGVWVYQRQCRRVVCGHVQRIGEVEFERKYAGR